MTGRIEVGLEEVKILMVVGENDVVRVVGYERVHSLLLGAIGGAVASWSQPPPYPWVG